MTSGRLVPSSYWRAAEIIEAVRHVPEAADLQEAYRTPHPPEPDPGGASLGGIRAGLVVPLAAVLVAVLITASGLRARGARIAEPAGALPNLPRELPGRDAVRRGL